MSRPRSPRLLTALGSGVVFVLVLALGLLVGLRPVEEEIDLEWMDEIVEHRHPAWEVPARIFDALGGGWVAIALVPLAVAVLFLVARRPWSALLFVVASAVSAGIVQALKRLYGRARPDDILLPLDSGAFPSGHVANAATLVVVLALLLGRTWVWIAGAAYVVLMALSRTYLGAHWVTDTVGGALLGVAVAVALWTVFAIPLGRERERPSPPEEPASNVGT